MATENPKNPRPYPVGVEKGTASLGVGRSGFEDQRRRISEEEPLELAETQRRLSEELEGLQHERAQLQRERAQLQHERAQLQMERAHLQEERSQLQMERGDLYRTAERQAFEFQKQHELLAAERSRLEREREKLYEQAQRYFESWVEEVKDKRAELSRAEQDLKNRELSLERRERQLRAEELRIVELVVTVTQQSERVAAELERIAGITPQEAKEELCNRIYEEAIRDQKHRLQALEERVKKEADTRAAQILSDAMQRLAGPLAKDIPVREVQLPSPEFKSRIIGKDGRNIRTFESVTGVELILEVEDFPDRVGLSSHDPLRREQARLCLEELVADGRIQPKRIEETYERACRQLDRELDRAGEEAVAEFGFEDMNKEIVSALGRLKLWVSAGQNVLEHLRECARLAQMIAEELSLDPSIATRGALLHDIGKGLRYDWKGPHALVGAEFARQHGERESVCHSIEAHHNEVEPRTVEAVLVQVADRLSGGRLGARAPKSEAEYVERLEELEEFCKSCKGVQEAYAFRAGREIRVVVDANRLDDTETRKLAKELKENIERERRFPKSFELTVIREFRITENVWGRTSR